MLPGQSFDCAARYLRERLGGQVGIGQHITTVQTVFGKLFNAGAEFARDGRGFDHLFADDEAFSIGSLRACAMHTPGHTPACMTYVVSDGHDVTLDSAEFVGDTLFMPDYGTARCDFPGGDARTLQREKNIHVRNGISEEAFVVMRHARDATLGLPSLMQPSVQINMRAGQLPEPEGNGMRYIKIPLNAM